MVVDGQCRPTAITIISTVAKVFKDVFVTPSLATLLSF